LQRASDSRPRNQLLLWSAKTPAALAKIAQTLAITSPASQAIWPTPPIRCRPAAAPQAAPCRCGLGNPQKPLTNRRALRLSFRTTSPSRILAWSSASPARVCRCRHGPRLYETEPVFRQPFDACDAILLPCSARACKRRLSHRSQRRKPRQRSIRPSMRSRPSSPLNTRWLSSGFPGALLQRRWSATASANMSPPASPASSRSTMRCTLHCSPLPPDAVPAARLHAGHPHRIESVQSSLNRRRAQLDIAAVNSPKLCVVSGTDAASTLHRSLDTDKIAHRKLAHRMPSTAACSIPMLDEFAGHVRKATFHAPSIPYVSSLTGNGSPRTSRATPNIGPITCADRPLCRRCAPLLPHPRPSCSKSGPSETLVQMMRQTLLERVQAASARRSAGLCLAGISERWRFEDKAMLTALGRLWAAGSRARLAEFHAGSRRKRVLLPTYPFDRKRFWVEPAATTAATAIANSYPHHSLPQPPSRPTETALSATPVEDLTHGHSHPCRSR
jgi:acyl transferase domain-containing protein